MTTSIAATIFLTVSVIVLLSYRKQPLYLFLDGHKPVHSYSQTHKGDTFKETLYSFKGDFSTICMAAKSELITHGYIDQTDPKYSNQHHEFVKLTFKLTTKQTSITIKEGDVFDAEATRDNPGHIVWGHKHGWISVSVMCYKPKFNARTFWRYWSRRLKQKITN